LGRTPPGDYSEHEFTITIGRSIRTTNLLSIS